MKTINLRIFTPDGLVYQNDIYTIETLIYKGRIGMFANQIPIVALIKPNLTIIKSEKGTEEFYLCNGLVYQKAKKIKIYASILHKKGDPIPPQWLEEKLKIENKIKKATDEILLIALNQQLAALNMQLELIGFKQ